MTRGFREDVFARRVGWGHIRFNREQVTDSSTNIGNRRCIQTLRKLKSGGGDETVEEVEASTASRLLLLMKTTAKETS